MEKWYQVIGLLSATLTTAAFIPQAIKTWKTKSTHDLSPMMFSLFCIGITCWLIYGILIKNLPVILSNSFTLVLAGSIMYRIIRRNVSARIAHIGLYVNDLEMMKNFYEEKFNARAGKIYINHTNGFTSCFLSFPSGSKIELMHQSSSGVQNMNNKIGHIALTLGDKKDIDSYINKHKNEIKIVNGPRITGDGYYECLLLDPEGNHLELTAEM